MWRYLAGGAAALALAGAAMLLVNGKAQPGAVLPPQPVVSAAAPQHETALPDAAPEATEKTREEKRFGRYDKDRDGKITRDEYLMQRHKAFAKLDTNHDGMLSFDEWAVKAEAKFAAADADKSGAMTPAEFATTAVKRKARTRVKCPPASAAPARDEES